MRKGARLTIFLHCGRVFRVPDRSPSWCVRLHASTLPPLIPSSPSIATSSFDAPLATPSAPAQAEITLMYLILSSQLPSYIFLNDLSFKCYCTYTAIEENVPFLALLFNTRAFFILTESPSFLLLFFLHCCLPHPHPSPFSHLMSMTFCPAAPYPLTVSSLLAFCLSSIFFLSVSLFRLPSPLFYAPSSRKWSSRRA